MPVKAVKTDDGFYVDPAAVLTRAGIFDYRDPATGKTTKEYRPPEEVFRADHLLALNAVPIISGVHDRVNSTNAKGKIEGIIMGPGRQDGENLVAPVKIWHTEPVDQGGLREFSLCYEIDLDTTPGEINGVRYDAVQRNIRNPNHLLLCKTGRAGVARLNLDAADDTEADEPVVKPKELNNMSKVRIDNGIEYEAAPEVAVYIGSLIKAVADVQKDKDGLQARLDAADAKNKELEKSVVTARGEGESAARSRLKLEAVAATHKVEFKSDTADKDIRIAVIKAIRGDSFDAADKSDSYLEVAFDLAVAEKQVRDDSTSRQRLELHGGAPIVPVVKMRADGTPEPVVNGVAVVSAATGRQAYIDRLNGVK
jgi:hypothetical protein